MLRRLVAHVLVVLSAVSMYAAAGVAAVSSDGKAVSVTAPWARATPGGSTIGAAYVDIAGTKDKGDKLIGASSPVAARIEIHTHDMADGVMKMRKVDGLAVAAGQTRKLAPGGDHLMLFDLKAPLKQGEVFPLTLKFETSGEITVDAAIQSVGAMAHDEKGAMAPGDAKSGSEGSDAGSHDGH